MIGVQTHLYQPGTTERTRCGRLASMIPVRDKFEPMDRICNACEEARRFRISEKTPWSRYKGPGGGGFAVYLDGTAIGMNDGEFFYDWEAFRKDTVERVHYQDMTISEFLDEVPGYAWACLVQVGLVGSESTGMSLAESLIDGAAEDLYEGAYRDVPGDAHVALARFLVAWDREHCSGVKTYSQNDRESVVLGPTFWAETIAKLDFAPEDDEDDDD